jgi:hypothetical protein
MLSRVVLVAALFLVGLSMTPTRAVIVYDSGGFEPPFVAGMPLEGQGPWVTTATNSTSLVQTAVKASGNQAVQITRAPNEDARWGVPVTGLPAFANGPHFDSMGHERFGVQRAIGKLRSLLRR